MLLNVHSYYSLRYGTLSPAELIEGMLTHGYDTAVLSDINNSTGVLEMIRLGREAGVTILAGMEYRNEGRLLYIGIAKNEQGFRELNELMTARNREGGTLPERAPAFNDALVVYPFGSYSARSLRENEYIGVRPPEVNRLIMESEKTLERHVILAPVSFDAKDYKLHCQLRAIDHNVLISQLEGAQVAPREEVFLEKGKLLRAYQSFPQLIRSTTRLLAECAFDFDFKSVKNKAAFTGNHYDDKQLLYKYTMDGLVRRYGKNDRVARERALKELDIIDDLHFSSYFLITDDICRYARGRSFHYVGRGSGANSIVAYCLGITDVCPVELDLYFERFLNPKRKSPPDFDIDFSWKDRDEMYDYIFRRYQSGHTALMGAMSTFRGRSMMRELGKVYGLPKGEIDRLIHEPQHLLNKNEVTELILSVCSRLEDFPNQRTIHASGVLISERPLTHYSALDYPPKGLPTMQFDMYVAEDIGFEKFDILSQRGIGHIRDCREIIKQNRGETVSTECPKRFFSDPKIAEQLRTGNTIGCFYIESPAMRQLLTKLQCADYLTLVAASSIIRPGVAGSGMMKAFIERHHDPSKVVYPHPVFREQLEETYGVMVYQEDVMKIGHHFGGLDLADADVLRRMMSGKYRDKAHLVEIEEKYFDHCRRMGYTESVSREIWRQMESFAGYSFNKAHSASFAVESYQSLFLKTYYPLEFMVAVLNNYGGFYHRRVYVNEARKAGGTVTPPCVNRSGYTASIDGKEIYLGFDCLLNLDSKLALGISVEREQSGPYTGLENFVLRTGAGLDQLVILIRAGAFRFLGTGKKELLWEAHLLLAGQKRQQESLPPPLFRSSAVKPVLPPLESTGIEDIYDEIELVGFPVSASMFELAKSGFRGDRTAKDLALSEGQTLRMVGDFVTDKDVRTKNGKRMKFGTFFDVHGDFFDTIHFAPSLAQYPLRGNGLYLLEGKVVLDFGCPALDVARCAKLPLKPDPRSE
ncbi:DNA polymerase III alpha subunit [Anseongella ginsenosidimutans]|uniref:DNA-directed DNA polymerase n=1 Tax=Anseongella ginsenosidimutans TaxID=496056 RepID=A0A4R3KT53_9SPHI|nr:DNA polymerase III subunit alpha [Anseongella ginsenosidimutans]QEC53065.1 DNA polymerase III subunit alpha [Anseongella ginsenosidimutans]TCS87681.1 DNA polymerase III alpha subunit [Anseongella ginsenosidimutans]